MNNNLNQLRAEIDAVDEQIIKLLSRRMKVVHKVGVFKKQNSITPLDNKRWQEVLNSKLKMAQQLDLDPELIKNIYESIHATALKMETLVQKS